jgi:hypothetical protein
VLGRLLALPRKQVGGDNLGAAAAVPSTLVMSWWTRSSLRSRVTLALLLPRCFAWREDSVDGSGGRSAKRQQHRRRNQVGVCADINLLG